MRVRDLLGDQRVRAEHARPFAGREVFARQPVRLLRHAARQKPAGYAQRLQLRPRAFIVLRGQNLRRRHHGALPPRARGEINRAERDGGLSAAHVALHQSRHGVRSGHIGGDFVQHAPLRARGREGERAPVGGFVVSARRNGRARAHVLAHYADGQLKQEQVFERQPVQCRAQPLRGGRKMRAAQRVVQRQKSEALANGFGQRVFVAGGFVQNFGDDASKHFRGHAGNRFVDGNQSLLRFNGGAGNLHPPVFDLAVPVQKQLASDLQLLPQPRLIEPHGGSASVPSETVARVRITPPARTVAAGAATHTRMAHGSPTRSSHSGVMRVRSRYSRGR